MPVVIRVQARGQAVTYAAVAVGRNRAAAEKTLPIALRFQSGFPSSLSVLKLAKSEGPDPRGSYC